MKTIGHHDKSGDQMNRERTRLSHMAGITLVRLDGCFLAELVNCSGQENPDSCLIREPIRYQRLERTWEQIKFLEATS